MPSPGSMPASSAAATCPMAPPVAIGRPRVCDRVCSDRSLNFTFTVIVRADVDAPRSIVATDSAMRSTWRSSSCGSTRSWLKVSSCPIDLLGRLGLTGIGVLAAGERRQMGAARLAEPPHQGVWREGGQVAHGAHAEVVQALGRGRADPPQRLDIVAVQERELVGRPRPGRRPAPGGARPGWPVAWRPARRAWRSSSSARSRRRRPAASSSCTRRRRPWAIWSGGPSRRSAPATSMKASSRPIGSTIGVMSARILCSSALTSRVAAVAPRQEDRIGAELAGPHRRHGRVHPVGAGLVGARGHDAAAPRPRPRSPACRPVTGRRAPRPTRRTRPCRRGGWWGASGRSATEGQPAEPLGVGDAGPPALLGRPPPHRLAGPAAPGRRTGCGGTRRRPPWSRSCR